MKAMIYMDGGGGAFERRLRKVHGGEVELEILKIEGDVVSLANEFAPDQVAHYSRTTGRRVNEDGSPHPPIGWLLDVTTVPRTTKVGASVAGIQE